MANFTKDFLAKTLANKQPKKYHAVVCATNSGSNCDCKTLSDAYRVIEEEFSRA